MLALVTAACGASEAPRHRSLSDDDIAAFGAERSASSADQDALDGEASQAIELADGERLEVLRALIRFDPGQGAAPTCALYALRAGGPSLAEGRATVACEDTDPRGEPDEDVSLAPVEDARGPLLIAALTGATVEPRAVSIAPASPDSPASPRTVHVWLTTDRRHIEGAALPVRWPIPGATEPEPPVGHRPANLSEVWEAVMYPERYR
ncbi:MAG: hypothetical protein JRH11_19460 [Deltaproteobacteria bacterium]|nr:hypothetical protein [Deltaproteobacteria bacterium]